MPSLESVSSINQLWTRRNLRWAAALMLIAPLLSLANSGANSGWSAQLVVPTDRAEILLALVLAIAFFAFSFTAIFFRHWQRIAWICCALAVINGAFGAVDRDGMIFCRSIVLFVLGTGALIPWSARWQAAFSFFCVAAFAVVLSGRRIHGAAMPIEWTAILTAIAIAQVATAMRERYARDREQSVRTVRDSEQKLRKVFELTFDSIGIVRLSDRRFIDVNPAFECIAGYSHAEMVGATSDELGLWLDQGGRDRFYAKLEADGQIEVFPHHLKTSTELFDRLLGRGLQLGGQSRFARRAKPHFHLPRHHKTQADPARTDRSSRTGARRLARQVRIPEQHVARNPHAHEFDPRDGRAASYYRDDARTTSLCAGYRQQRRCAS